jgi:hypothetical protein
LAALAIRKRSAANEPSNLGRQRDLSMSYEKIGSLQAAQRDHRAALANFQTSLGIRERLTASDPRNTQWQRDVSVSHNLIGGVQLELGDKAAALQSYRADLAVAERLAATDPNNAEWQRDVMLSCWTVADFGSMAGPTDARRALLQRGLDILRDQRQRKLLSDADMPWIGRFERALGKLK